MAKELIEAFTIEKLNEYEKACSTLCRYYENAIKTYNGSLNTDSSDYKTFQKYNNIRLKIIEAMEAKIKLLE